MRRIGIAFFGIVLLLAAVTADQAVWTSFKQEYKKHYENAADEEAHKKVFLENLNVIAHHNELFKAGKVSNEFGINEFTDMSDDEFYSTRAGFIPDISDSNSNDEMSVVPSDAKVSDSMVWQNKEAPSNLKHCDIATLKVRCDAEIPDSIDWRAKGAVTPAKDYKLCWSTWSLAAIGALEGQYFLKTGELVEMSPQNLIDCVTKDAKECYGVHHNISYDYLMKNGGIESEKTYPYTGNKGACTYCPKNSVTKITGYVDIAKNEMALTHAIATVGPIVVYINAGGLKHHKSGIYCQSAFNLNTSLDHHSLAVGYGSDENGDYYILKSLLGKNFAEDGFFKMARNSKDHCGITRLANYPKL